MIFVIAVTLSFGWGFDFESQQNWDKTNVKGIAQIEGKCGDYTCGFFHASQLSNGFNGKNSDDANIGYIKWDFDL